MLNNELYKDLIPLRKFAREGILTKSYLSILVQRKKLKAVKIGRNYFTTIEWFCDYVKLFTKDEKTQLMWDICNEVEKNNTRTSPGKGTATIKEKKKENIYKAPRLTESEAEVGFLMGKYGNLLRTNKLTLALFAAFLFAAFLYLYDLRGQISENEKGTVSGVEESASTTTPETPKDKIMIIDDTEYKVSDSVSSKKGEIKTLEKVEK